MLDVTPVQTLPDAFGSHVFMKREDLLPFSFGGNKLRIAQEFFADMEKQGCDCMIGYGNARSNLCRVLAAMAQAKNVPCYIISPDDEDGSRTETFNSRLVRTCGARLVPCQKTQVKETVETVLAACRDQGMKPYYIYGNSEGKGNEAVPAEAYVKAAAQIAEQEEELGISFDRIYLASGTGMTQAGLLIGTAKCSRPWEIIGISIARPAERCAAVVRERIRAYFEKNGGSDLLVPPVRVKDDYLLEGYGKWNKAVSDVIYDTYRRFGIPLDPTYSGKAFWGMMQELEKNPAPGKNILFLHTGGGPLFFDFIQR